MSDDKLTEELRLVQVEEDSGEKNQKENLLEHNALMLALSKIEQKVLNSPALNGGFETLMVKIDHITEKQTETSAQVNKIHDALYEPDTGFFSRVKTIESNTDLIKKELNKHEEEDERINNEVEEYSETTKKLTRIAGKDLEKISALVKMRGTLNKLFWILVPVLVTSLGKLLWDVMKQGGH